MERGEVRNVWEQDHCCSKKHGLNTTHLTPNIKWKGDKEICTCVDLPDEPICMSMLALDFIH